MAQPDFIVTGAGPELKGSGPDHLTLAILKHSTILEKSIQITMNSVPVHNNSRHVYIEILYKVHLASFTNMATVGSEIVPETWSPGS